MSMGALLRRRRRLVSRQWASGLIMVKLRRWALGLSRGHKEPTSPLWIPKDWVVHPPGPFLFWLGCLAHIFAAAQAAGPCVGLRR